MSASEANPPMRQESKSAKKKKAKAEGPAKEATAQPEVDAGATKSNVDGSTNGVDGAYESPYLKELYKYILHW